jgi:hypothetical protein
MIHEETRKCRGSHPYDCDFNIRQSFLKFYQSGRDAQRESDAALVMNTMDISDIYFEIDNNTGDL